MLKWLSLGMALGLVFSVVEIDARNFRQGMLPNAPANCNTCHTTGGGTPRNAFGLAVETLVTPGGREVFWGAALAALDSDGDGFTNGQELGDPDGDGKPDPLFKATLPGSATSFPQVADLLGPLNKARVVAVVTQNGTPVVGAEVALARSVAGLATVYSWKGTTNANGQVIVDIEVTNRSASGYYLAKATNSAGVVIASAGSMPINGATTVALALASPSASKVASLSNSPNPFNPATQIHYALDAPGTVRLTVYNTLGQEVIQLVNAQQSVGTYVVTWNAQNAASGLYFYRLDVDGQIEMRKMLLVK